MADDDKVKIKVSTITYAAISLAFIMIISYIFLNPAFSANTYTITFVLSVLLLAWGSFYFYRSHKQLNEMCCMMNVMVFSMMASFVLGAIIALPTGNFMLGIITGTLTGFLIGIPLGKLTGHLSLMEGIMAAPMGGSMGAMLGIMIRFYEVQLFMQFLLVVLIFIVLAMSRINYSNTGKSISTGMKYVGIILSVVLLVSAASLDFSVDPTSGGIVIGQPSQGSTGADFSAPVVDGKQEIDLRMEVFDYSPSEIIVRKDVPVKINLKADSNAGCTRSIVFPAFGISKVVPKGGTETIEFTPTQTGSFPFRCSMAMARGTITVKNV